MERPFVRRLALVVAALLATLAIPAVAAAAEPELPEDVEVEFGDDVSVITRWFVNTAVDRSWEFFEPLLEEPEAFDASIVVVTNADDAAAVWAKKRGVSLRRARQQWSARSGTYAGLATTGLTVIINDNNPTSGATVHEVVHLVQHHIAGRTQGPRWLSEGAAEYFSMLIESEWGIDSGIEHPKVANRAVADEWAATTRNCVAGRLPADGETCRWATDSLHRLEQGDAFNIGGGAVSAYARAALGFQLLIDRFGEAAYFCYLQEQGRGSGWRTAFRECFGSTVDEYYRYFDVLRARGFNTAPVNPIPEML